MSDFSFQKIYSHVYLPIYLSFTGNVPSPQQPPVPRPGRRGRDPIPVPEPEDQVSWKWFVARTSVLFTNMFCHLQQRV